MRNVPATCFETNRGEDLGWTQDPNDLVKNTCGFHDGSSWFSVANVRHAVRASGRVLGHGLVEQEHVVGQVVLAGEQTPT